MSRDFDVILDGVLTNYQNITLRDSDGNIVRIDTSQGSLIFMKSAALASVAWGLEKRDDWVKKQIFADTADTQNLEHHCWLRGIKRLSGEDDVALLDRYLYDLRHPPGGGNKYDYVRWAREVEGVANAWCLPIYYGTGTVAVVIKASGDSEVPTQDLIDAVYAHIDDVRPVCSKLFYVLAPEIITQDVTMYLSGSDISTAAIAADIYSLMSAYVPGDCLYVKKLQSIAYEDENVNDILSMTPSENSITAAHQMIRPGVISVQVI